MILTQASPDLPIAGEDGYLPPLVNTLSDEAMARMIGSVRVVVNRHLQDFIKMDMISTTRGELVVRDLEKLREYCGKALGE
jgi:hypothetical protein